MVVALKKSNRFYCVQAAKTIKSKDVVKNQILLRVATNFGPFFKFQFSSDQLLKMKSNDQLALLRIGSYLMFSTALA